MESAMDKKIINSYNAVKKKREAFLVKAMNLLSDGVLIEDPERLDIRGDLICGKNVKIDLNVIIEGTVKLANGVSIGANCILRNCSIGKDSTINPYSLVEQSSVGENTFIGPFSRLRPNSIVEDNVQIGNYVEIKNSVISSNCRINHHSFIGDAFLDNKVTLGAGTITCNHDGYKTNTINIGKDVYVGSGSNLVAPLKIESNSTIASGSTITDDVMSDTLVIARSRQLAIKNWPGPKSRRNSKNISSK
jgi:bifunctional UDP-N-acetylglucosamine pyrophosphorylase / glucosamine-1-phosphate N-acetyltransferase